VHEQPTTVVDTTNVTDHFNLKGAYFTLRFGPTLIIPLTEDLNASLSFGAAMVYAGTTYTVDQDFQPDTGPEITSTVSTTRSYVMPGYFANADMEYWLTKRTGLYVGAAYQGSGSYTQKIHTDSADYSTTVDLKDEQGVHLGVDVKF